MIIYFHIYILRHILFCKMTNKLLYIPIYRSMGDTPYLHGKSLHMMLSMWSHNQNNQKTNHRLLHLVHPLDHTMSEMSEQ